ncbi:hypothetical protein H310_08082 [Aphanomyces invadans]|nr:hypothetical protein H310_08082 [Aphanomyces invadans]ETV99369.1 hypothetical protein H310_08082 [Aphanomyces invadans]|eukprot:XP_008871925.1 hypothetical protein H310_08082 [Aphanomyces invadans]
MSILKTFKSYDMTNIFRHCGYSKQGRFDPSKRLVDEDDASSDINDNMLEYVPVHEDEREEE